MAMVTGAARIQEFANGGAGLNVGLERSKIANQLAGLGGRHVVVVHYGSQHNVEQEWVYNGANIDAAPVVWAHDRGSAENQNLLKYFADRTVWFFDPDATPATLRRYTESR